MELPKLLQDKLMSLDKVELENWRKRVEPLAMRKFKEQEILFSFDVSEEEIKLLKKDLAPSIARLLTKIENDEFNIYDFPYLIIINDYCELIRKHQVSNSDDSLENKDEMKISNLKANEKIIILNELGVINFLRNHSPFDTSTNRLANVLALITGEKMTTLQSYLNPIISNNVQGNNNPYKREETVERIRARLISLSVDLDEFNQ